MQYSIPDAGKTTIDNSFIQEYLICAPAQYVKVYIIALSKIEQGSNQLSIMEIARALESGVLEISKAFEYWREKGVIDIIEDDGFKQTPIENLEEVRNYETIKLIFKNLQTEQLSTGGQTRYEVPNTPETVQHEINTRDSFQEFISKLEYTRKGKTLSYEAVRRLAYYKNNLGLSVELLELACNLSYDNPNVKESNHLNYARGILNNFYEANIFTIEDYYRRERQKDYKVPSPEEVEQSKRRYPLHRSTYTNRENTRKNYVQNREKPNYKISESGRYTGRQKDGYEKVKSEPLSHENVKIDKIQQNIDAQRMNMRKKLNRNTNNR